MIFVNGQKLDVSRFPDKTLLLRFPVVSARIPYEAATNILWQYDSDEECMIVWNLVHHIRSIQPEKYINLILPYIPNARMDRVKEQDEVFTLKWFAEFINTLRFQTVKVLDPHSNVAAALIDRVCMIDVMDYIKPVLKELNNKMKLDLLFCYPDEGAAKRYSDKLSGDYVFGIKHRDWSTGRIEKLEIAGADKVSGRNILIVDDICSRGGTFTYTANALKAAGAERVFLYVTHCEDTIHKGFILTDNTIEAVYTTDSILRTEHEKIHVLPV